MRGLFLIGFAIVIDALQGMFALIFIAFEAVTPVGGGVGAAAACAAFSDGLISKLTNGVTCFIFGAGTSAFAIPIGAAVDVVISITLGTALIATLALMGMFYPGTVLGAFIGESIPLLDAIIPGWTLMAWRCVHNKKVEEKKKQQAAMEVVVRDADTPTRLQPFNDIRPVEEQYA